MIIQQTGIIGEDLIPGVILQRHQEKFSMYLSINMCAGCPYTLNALPFSSARYRICTDERRDI